MKGETKGKEAIKTGESAQGEESLIYVGPTIPGIAIQNTVYTKIPEKAKDAMKECVSLRNLFMPVRMYSTAEEMLRLKEGYIYRAFCKALLYEGRRKK